MKAKLARVKLVGLKPLMKRLKQLPPKSQRAVLRPAVNKAGTQLVKEAKRQVPVKSGLLKSALMKTRPKVYKSGAVALAVGAAMKKAFHAHLVHDGTKPHDIRISRPLRLFGIAVLPRGYTIHHPGAQPNQFLTRATEIARDRIQQALEKAIAKGIEKQAAKLAKQGGKR